jgi:dipeptidyl aminopeptidase/acylaminoacyl peptidase
MRTRFVLLATLALWIGAVPLDAQEQRPMEHADLWRQVSIGQTDLSPDGTRLLYTSNPNSFPEQSRNQQIHMVTLDGSVDIQLTHARDAQHAGPRWHPSGDFFGFTANRGEGRQVYLMSPEGGEARQVTDAQGGVASWEWSHDGRYLAYLAGRGADRQLWVMDGEGRRSARQITEHPTPVQSFQWRTTGHQLFFVAADDWDSADDQRRRDGFEARPIQRGLVFPDFITMYPQHLWRVAAHGGQATRVTEGDFRVQNVEESPTGDRVALVLAPVDPYADNRPNEVYLLDPESGELERLTDNDVSESIQGFSPDGSLLAITASRDFEGRVNDIFVRSVDGGDWRSLTGSFDNDISSVTWGPDGSSFYFVGADGVNRQLYEVGIADGEVRRLSDHRGVVSIQEVAENGQVVVQFATPDSPGDFFALDWGDAGTQGAWTQLTDANPWVREVHLAETETVRWTSDDGTEVEGLLVYPLNYDPARQYPLITEIHGGPASAFENGFLPTSGNPHRAYGHLLAAMDYALFLPNYRGSSNYGEHFKAQLAGDYWTGATEDIMTGIDHLIDRGIAHPDSLGLMGWSAGGHWSNWLLVHTDRFQAIASGAGVANWISLYGQTDNQSSREFYLGGDPSLDAPNQPWHDFDHWWDESPLKYIMNASTPTLFHYPQADQRIPMPQGQELHMALKKLGVRTEFLVYPDELHALRDPRNQLVKLMGDVGWFEHHLRGQEHWLDWGEILQIAGEIENALAEDRPLAANENDREDR